MTGKASPLKWHRVYKSFGILIKLVIPLEIWDAFGMKAVKSFGILVEGYPGGRAGDHGNRQEQTSRLGYLWDRVN